MVPDGRLPDLVPEFVGRLLHRFDDNRSESTNDVLPLRLEELDAPNSLFAQVMSELKDEIRRQSAPQRRIHNENSRINQLPVEMLSIIFAYLLAHRRSEGEARWHNRTIEKGAKWNEQMLDLLSVCAHWHKVIHGTPELWSHIELGYSEATIQTFLDRSKKHPLTIVCVDIGRLRMRGQQQNKKLDLPSFLCLTMAQFFRCASATFLGVPSEYANYFENMKAHTLRSLSIQYRSPVPNGFPNILDGDAPMLRALSVSGCIPLGGPRILQNLTSLTLERLEVSNAESGEKLRLLLHDSCNLRYLRLASISIREGGMDAFPSIPLSFPTLETLVLSGVPQGLGDVLLQNAKIPNEILLDYESGRFGHNFRPVDEPLDPLKLHSIFRYIPKHSLLTIAKTGMRTNLLAYPLESCGNRGLELRENSFGITLGRMLQAFVNLTKGGFIPAPSHVTVKIGGCAELEEGREWLDSLNELPLVTALEVDRTEVISPLLAELDFRDDMTEWYLPQIQSLTLLSNYSAAATLAVLQRRYQDRTPGGPGNTGNLVGLDPPTPLSLLSITDEEITPEVVQALRDLLGTSGVLQWRKDRDEPWNIG